MTSRLVSISSLSLALRRSPQASQPLNPHIAHPSPGESSPRAELPMQVRVALTLLRGYKVFMSPYFRGSCRFLPSCADYTAEAIERHGVLIGCSLGARRLVRCHPLGRAGYDPVPLRTER
jgi:putative membrane protein insertion efficiency factor